MAFIDRCIFVPTAGGTADWTYSAAVTGYQSPTAAGAIGGLPYRYAAQSADLGQWEVGYGNYTSSNTTFARTTVLFNSVGGTSAINFSAAPQVAILPLGEDFREKLPAARTYYFSASGSDSSNTGLSSASAFLTPQKAYDTIVQNLDLGGQTVTIQGTSAATFTASNSIGMSKPWTGGGNLIIDGGGGTFNPSGQGAIYCTANLPGRVTLQNVTLQSSGTATAIAVEGAATISIGSGVEFSSMSGGGDHMSAAGGGVILTPSAYTISGSARIHANARPGGLIDMYAGAGGVTTISAAVTMSLSFVYAQSLGCVFSVASVRTFSGSSLVTGTRFTALPGGTIYSQGGGLSYFPGSAAGTPTAVSSVGTYA
jgi:hypothetical protein